MLGNDATLIDEVRGRFAHVESDPFGGERIFFENAGGALTLKSVVETSAKFAAIPDNQGRDNPTSAALMEVIAKARADAADFFNAPGGQVIVGESGTELLFRLLRAACEACEGGTVISSSLEHPASRSAAVRGAAAAGLQHLVVEHDHAAGTVGPDAYAKAMTPEVRVATIVHASPVTGMGTDVAAIARVIREVSPECLIVVDGIQHAAHGHVDIAAMGIDGYVVSPYKMFARHGFGLAWLSDRLSLAPHDLLDGAAPAGWELGTRDTGAYAVFSDVIDYLVWLGGAVGSQGSRRDRIEAAAGAIHAHEQDLTKAMLRGIGNQKGLAELPGVTVIGGVDNPAREGLVSLVVAGIGAEELVAELRARGVRTHARKADHYSGNVLEPLGYKDCLRVSMCHYNTEAEVAAFLAAMAEITQP